jgi:predicted transcriptional regulator
MPHQSKWSKTGRRKTGKITVSVRLSPETKALLDKAAEQFRLDSFSAYVEEAVLERLKRDKIHPEKLTKRVKRRL